MTAQPAHWSLRHFHGIGSPKWAKQVDMRLQAGYGAEDIALWLDCHAQHVRNYVKVLRGKGKLTEWWPA